MKSALVGIASAVLATLLMTGGALGQCCGDCNSDGVVTVDEIVKGVTRALLTCQDDGVCDTTVANCSTNLSNAQAALTSCTGSLSSCNMDLNNAQASLGTCNTARTQCQTDLADCRAQAGGQRFPASGQMTSYGPGSDGDVRAGAALAHTDNHDGTITDHNTGLMWEKKDDSGGIHDLDNTYTWGMTSAPYTMNGTMVTTFLTTLNAGSGFAGYTDWRVPNVKELQSIVDYEIAIPEPTADAAFHNPVGCMGCTDVTLVSCSCTRSGIHWSSTTDQSFPGRAWIVNFRSGFVTNGSEDSRYAVRAVRGGL